LFGYSPLGAGIQQVTNARVSNRRIARA